MVTIEDARVLAKKIKESGAKVYGVELFGSVLEKGEGHDVDFMLIVDDNLAFQFWSITSDTTPRMPARLLRLRRFFKKFLPFVDEIFIKKRNHSRQARLSKLIGLDLAGLGTAFRPGVIIDAWLMPNDWRSHITQITQDPNMRVILKAAARSVVRLD